MISELRRKTNCFIHLALISDWLWLGIIVLGRHHSRALGETIPTRCEGQGDLKHVVQPRIVEAET
jgi:hypothetical protein